MTRWLFNLLLINVNQKPINRTNIDKSLKANITYTEGLICPSSLVDIKMLLCKANNPQQLLLSFGLLLPDPSTQGLDLFNIIQTIQGLSLTHFMPVVLLELHIQIVQINMH